MSHSVVVMAETAAGWEVDAFDGVPVVVPVSIAIAAGDAAMMGDVATLRRAIGTILAGAAPGVTVHTLPPISGNDPNASPWLTDMSRAAILVLVCSSTHATPSQPRLTPWSAPTIKRSVLPIFAAGGNPSTLLPTKDLQALNASFWKSAPTECIPAIFGRVGLTTSDQRVFISYRRLETQPLAEQLFDALSHDGFDVFVDRFSVSPGVDFQRRLDQELADKSMVVLLESKGIETSDWTKHEILFTKKYRLGFLSLMLPDRVAAPLVGPHRREHLQPSDFVGPPTRITDPASKANVDQWGALTAASLARVVASVKSAHDAAMFDRRRYIQDVMIAALDAAHVTNRSQSADGLMTVQSNGKSYVIWLTTRPPGLPDFHTTHPRTITPASTGVIVGPTALLESTRVEQLTWLTSVSRVVWIDEDDITEAAKRIGRGAL